MAGAIGPLLKALKVVQVVTDSTKHNHFPPERTLKAFILLCAHKYGKEYYDDKKVSRETLLQKVAHLVDNHLVSFTNVPPSVGVIGFFTGAVDLFKIETDPVLHRLDRKIYEAALDWVNAKFWNKEKRTIEHFPFTIYFWNGKLEDFCGESLSASLTTDERSALLSVVNEDYDPLPHAS